MTAEQEKNLEAKLENLLEEMYILFQEVKVASCYDVPQQEVENSEKALVRRVTEMFKEIGIPANIVGYEYARTAIMKVYKDYDFFNVTMKDLYQYVAEIYEVNVTKVERGIRVAIDKVWHEWNAKTLQKYFGYSVSSKRGKPTNSEFIAVMVEQLHFQDDN